MFDNKLTFMRKILKTVINKLNILLYCNQVFVEMNRYYLCYFRELYNSLLIIIQHKRKLSVND